MPINLAKYEYLQGLDPEVLLQIQTLTEKIIATEGLNIDNAEEVEDAVATAYSQIIDKTTESENKEENKDQEEETKM